MPTEVERQMHDFQQALSALPVGQAIFPVPDHMTVGDVRLLEARVGLGVPDADLRHGLEAASDALGIGLHVSDEMTATLQGPAFKVTARTPELQHIAMGIPATWSWDVEALKAGKEQELRLWVSALVYLPGGTTAVQPVTSLVRTITIDVAPLGFRGWLNAIAEAAKSLEGIGGFLAAICAFFAGWYGRLLARARRTNRGNNGTPISAGGEDTT